MPDPRPRLLQIFGERCSGTNYVAQLLRRNLGLEPTDRYGWKHGYSERVTDAAPECLFLVVHRDPLTWVQSLCRKPWHAGPPLHGLPLAEFVRAPWWCQWGQDMELDDGDERIGTEMMHERDPATGERFANVMRLRTAKHRDWHTLPDRVRHCALVRYEDAAADPKRFVRELASRFGLRRRWWFRRVRTFKGGSRRFVARQYDELAARDREWILGELDAAVERRAGYASGSP